MAPTLTRRSAVSDSLLGPSASAAESCPGRAATAPSGRKHICKLTFAAYDERLCFAQQVEEGLRPNGEALFYSRKPERTTASRQLPRWRRVPLWVERRTCLGNPYSHLSGAPAVSLRPRFPDERPRQCPPAPWLEPKKFGNGSWGPKLNCSHLWVQGRASNSGEASCTTKGMQHQA